MKKLFLVLLSVLGMFACKKESTVAPVESIDTTLSFAPKKAIFRSKGHADSLVKMLVHKFTPAKAFLSIRSISYIQSKNCTYALVGYMTDKGFDNLIINKKYRNGEAFESGASKCASEWCDCKVISTVDNAGNVSIGCSSCSTCAITAAGLPLD